MLPQPDSAIVRNSDLIIQAPDSPGSRYQEVGDQSLLSLVSDSGQLWDPIPDRFGIHFRATLGAHLGSHLGAHLGAHLGGHLVAHLGAHSGAHLGTQNCPKLYPKCTQNGSQTCTQNGTRMGPGMVHCEEGGCSKSFPIPTASTQNASPRGCQK